VLFLQSCCVPTSAYNIPWFPIGDLHFHMFLSLENTIDPIEEPVDSTTKEASTIELKSFE
jgi:hypothetical protein